MARHVCTLEGRPLPAADDPQVVAFLPDSLDAAVVAVDGSARRLGAVWWVLREPPLLLDREGSPLPELAIAVVEGERGRGIGRALLDALVERARGRFPAMTLNVHLLNPAVRLYIRAGFKVAAAGGLVRSRHESAARLLASFTRGIHSRTLAHTTVLSFAGSTNCTSGTRDQCAPSREASSRSALRRPSSASFSTGQSSISAASRCEHQAKASCSSGSSVGSLRSVTSAPNATT